MVHRRAKTLPVYEKTPGLVRSGFPVRPMPTLVSVAAQLLAETRAKSMRTDRRRKEYLLRISFHRHLYPKLATSPLLRTPRLSVVWLQVQAPAWSQQLSRPLEPRRQRLSWLKQEPRLLLEPMKLRLLLTAYLLMNVTPVEYHETLLRLTLSACSLAPPLRVKVVAAELQWLPLTLLRKKQA
jgi:hypothetical protein